MNILIPIDETQRYRSVLRYLRALKLTPLNLKFVHVASSGPGFDAAFASIEAIKGTTLQQPFIQRLQFACQEANRLGMPATWELCEGNPVAEVVKAGEKFDAKLVAMASSPKTALERIVSGRIALGIAEKTNRNVLIVRSDLKEGEKIRAVYATDHSDSSRLCLNRLFGMRPSGIAEVEVLTAFQLIGKEVAMASDSTVVNRVEVDDAIRSILSQKTEEIARRFRQFGFEAHATCRESSADQAIRECLGETSSNMLIFASRETSFWSRLNISHVESKEIKTGHSSLLILRPYLSASPYSTGQILEGIAAIA